MENEKKIDLLELRKEFLKEVRGSRTQNYLNQKLGFDFNQCYKWESGDKKFLWTDFVDVAHALRLDLKPALVSLFRYFGDPKDYGSFVFYLCQGRKVSEISRNTGISRDRIGRWFKNVMPPNLEDVFSLIITYYPMTLLTLISSWVDIRNIDSLYDLYGELVEFHQFFAEHPYVYAVSRCLELDEYKKLPKHDDNFIANRLGISPDVVALSLEELSKKRIVSLRKNVYFLNVTDFSIRMGFEREKPIRQFYIDQASSFIRRSNKFIPRGCALFYDVYACNGPDIRKIIDKCYTFYREIRQMVNKSANDPKHPKDRIRIMNLSLINPGDFEK